jgi:hypothetical protein
VTNTASVTPPPGGVCLPDDTPPPCQAAVTNPYLAQISVTETSSMGTAPLPLTGQVVYTLTVSNNGNVDASGTTVSDPLPPRGYSARRGPAPAVVARSARRAASMR